MIEPTKITVAEYMFDWLDRVAALRVGAKTLERYRELVERQIVPHLGATKLQALRPAQIQAWHATLRTAGRKDGGALRPWTVRHADNVLRRGLADAAAAEIIVRNPAHGIKRPRLDNREVEIPDAAQITEVLARLDGLSIQPIARLAFLTGMRLGEIVGLQLGDIDLDAATLRVIRSVEQTRAAGLAFKGPKTARGRRTIALSTGTVELLRGLRRQRLELRAALGQGRLPDDALVFCRFDGSPRSKNAVSRDWQDARKKRSLPNVSFHALRHAHASALIAAGVDPITVSRRLGHSSPAFTLSVYGHLFRNTDERAAEAIDAALALSSISSG